MRETNECKVMEVHSCKFCGRIVKDEWNFCPFCKSSLEIFKCKHCGKKVKANWKYCPECKNVILDEVKCKIVMKIDSSNRDMLSKKFVSL